MAPPSPPSAPPQDNNGDEPSCYHQIWRRGSHVDLPGVCDPRSLFFSQCLHPHKNPFPVSFGRGPTMTRGYLPSSRLPSSPHVVPAPSPARWVSPRPPGRPSWGLWGREGSCIARAIPFSAGRVESRDSQPEVAGPSWSSQRPRHALPHAPVAYPMRWPLGATARRRCWRRRRPKRPSQIFLAGRRRRAALDCRPPL